MPEYEKIIHVWADAASVKESGCDIAARINNMLFYTSTAVNSLKQFLNIDSLERALEKNADEAECWKLDKGENTPIHVELIYLLKTDLSSWLMCSNEKHPPVFRDEHRELRLWMFLNKPESYFEPRGTEIASGPYRMSWLWFACLAWCRSSKGLSC